MAGSLALHIIGFVMWAGGLMFLTRFMTVCIEGSGEGEQTAAEKLVVRLFLGWVLPGLIIVVFTGLFQLGVRGLAFYAPQAWFHTKLLLVFLLIALTVVAGKSVKQISDGDGITKKKAGILHGVTGLLFIAIVFLTMLGR